MMENLLQLFAHGCDKWVASCGRWGLRGDGCRQLVGVNGKQVSVCISSKTRQNQVD